MAGEFRASMLITAETGQARIAIGALRGETDQLGAAATKAGQSAKAGGAGFTAAGTAAGATAAEFLQTVSAASALDAAIKGLGVDMDRLRQPATAMGTFAVLGEQSQSLSQIAADWRLSAEEARLYQAALDQVRAQYDPLFAASQRYEAELRQIAEAERLGAISAATAEAARARAAQSLTPGLVQVGQSAEAARAHVANLGFQANDIFMMMAAGQNPMMLAIQQGTQVAQVFGQMRASGQSLGAGIKSALLGMVNPLSLVTMGVIALGAWAVQSFMGAGEEALAFEDRLQAMAQSLDRVREHVRLLADQNLAQRFGSMTREARDLTAALLQLDQAAALREMRATLEATLTESVKPSFWQNFGNALSQSQTPGVYADVDLEAANFEKLGSALPYDEFNRFRAEIDALAKQGDVEAVTQKIADLISAMAGGKAFSDMGEDAQTLVAQLAAVALKTAELEGWLNGSAQKAAGEARARDAIAAAERENELAYARLAYGEQSAQARAVEAQQQRDLLEIEIARQNIDPQGDDANRQRIALAERQRLAEAEVAEGRRQAADEMLAQFAAEARVNELSAKWGADSLEVAYARASAEREVYAAQLEAQGITGPLADDLMNAWDAARGIASINMAAGIAAAAAEALLLAQNLGVSLKTAAAIASMGMTMADGSVVKPGPAQPPGGGLSFGGTSGSLGGGLGGGAGLTYGANPGSAGSVAGIGVPGTGTGKGGGGGGAKAEADALEELLAREREQIAALKILDPVQAEIEKNHLALKDATDEEKLAVADLIAKRMKLEEIRDRLDEIGETGRSAFQQLLSGATSFGGAISMVLEKLAEMAASEAWDLIWGGGGLNLGGILGDLFGLGSAPAKADGGQVRGQGGPREDNLLHWLSAGEYVVNAAATAGALPLLEAINAGVPVHRLIDVIGGRRPAYADGGLVGGLVGDRAPAAWSRVTGGGSANEARAAGRPARQDRLEVAIHLDNDLLEARITDTSTGVASRVTRRGLEEFSAQALPARVRAIQAEPRRIG